ncbi:hypothetical protein PPL_00672 [Heterostelium album PN500]|uniref:Uncharacterized protein n=1 Tax=Heterostelium pallidum (strain ATCC 26659 / Pp 5 / PN500) TaxID=670386 RepID=D3AX43_HETP5|nr:hypothetical protein PPL_00672 [Heterostelium album PN500]EFA86112.1 hypothetical protein PPL_00672 [Heterostelium album PN500]|eukprot:XP_020438217.1 hypothetical protein PPL_00672 [Heterostelium album PN500]
MVLVQNYRPIKLVIVGDSGVGKTCMLITHCSKSFPTEYIPVVFDNYTDSSSVITVDGFRVSLGYWDTTVGRAEYDRIRVLCYPSTDLFLICFSVVNQESFANVSGRWYPEIRQHCPDTPFILVGTKSDLTTDSETLEILASREQTVVTPEQIEYVTEHLGAIEYFECSALINYGLQPIFDKVIQTVLYPQYSKKNSSKCTIL